MIAPATCWPAWPKTPSGLLAAGAGEERPVDLERDRPGHGGSDRVDHARAESLTTSIGQGRQRGALLRREDELVAGRVAGPDLLELVIPVGAAVGGDPGDVDVFWPVVMRVAPEASTTDCALGARGRTSPTARG